MSKSIVEITYYVNVNEANMPKSGPECVTDEHLDSMSEAIEFAEQFMRENPDVISAEVSEYTLYSDGSGVGSDHPVHTVTREDLVEAPAPR